MIELATLYLAGLASLSAYGWRLSLRPVGSR